jgi:hypothetical protein
MVVNASSMTNRLKEFFGKIDPAARQKALAAAGMELINYVVLGKGGDPVRPPIRTGRLRGSGTVFVGNIKIGDTLFAGSGTPASSITERNPDVVTIGFNTEYAARMHEHMVPGTPDPIIGKTFVPRGDPGKSGGKFLERHLIADAKNFFDTYSQQYRKFAGT